MTAVAEAVEAIAGLAPLEQLKDAVNGHFLCLAGLIAPDTLECGDCARAGDSLCPDHGADAAKQQHLEKAAADVLEAASPEDIWNIIIRAWNNGRQFPAGDGQYTELPALERAA